MSSTKITTTIITILALLALGVAMWWALSSKSGVPAMSDVSTTTAPTSTADVTYSLTIPDLATSTYAHFVDWPPQLEVRRERYSCTPQADSEASGITVERLIEGHQFCVTHSSEGAAGSVYHSYTYTTAAVDDTLVYTFTVQEVQCLNFDEPEASTCAAAQADFDPDNVALSLLAHTQSL